MTVEQILSDIKELTLEDKILLLASLQKLLKIEEKESKYNEMVKKYVGTMKELVGGEFRVGQKRQHVQAKIVLAICLMEDGCSLTTASHIIGVDHSSVSNYKKVWENVLRFPKQYADVIRLYNKFRESI